MAGFLAYIMPVDSGAHPEHPIAPGGAPPGIWGPTDPRPGWGLPQPPPGIWGGGPFPTPPIIIPPDKPNTPPLVIWGGGNVPFPTPPINLPDQKPPPEGGPPQKLVEWRTAWTPATGWIIVGIPQVPVPSPAADSRRY